MSVNPKHRPASVLRRAWDNEKSVKSRPALQASSDQATRDNVTAMTLEGWLP